MNSGTTGKGGFGWIRRLQNRRKSHQQHEICRRLGDLGPRIVFLQKMMNRLVETGKKYEMEINLEKSKVMRISRTEAPIHITVQNEQIEEVDGFKYLASWIEKDGRCEKDIRTRIPMTKMAFNRNKTLFGSDVEKGLKRN